MMKLTKRKTDYLFTFGTEALAVLSGLIVYRLAANMLGDLGFAEYSLARRAISLIQPVLILGLGVGIPRYIAFARAEGKDRLSDTYFAAGLFWILAFTVFALLLLNLFQASTAYLLFGEEKFGLFILPLSVMLFGLVLHSCVYAYFRGTLKMNAANGIQIINVALLPPAAFLLSETIQELFYYTGLATTVVSAVYLVAIAGRMRTEKSMTRKAGREILIYGIQRVPGDIALSGFLAAPAFIVVHVCDITTAGYVAFGISLVGIIASAFAPISPMLLPEASKMIAEKKFGQLKREMKLLTGTVSVLIIAGLAVFQLLPDTLIKIYLGTAPHELVSACVLLIFASLGYSWFIVLRSIVDAYYTKAINTKNIIIAFIIFVIASYGMVQAGLNYAWILLAFVLAATLLGILTIYEVVLILRRNK